MERLAHQGVYDAVARAEELVRQTRIDAERAYAPVTMDLSGASKLAEEVARWTETKSLDLYQQAKQKGVEPWQVLEEIDPSPRNINGEMMVPLDALERVLYVMELDISSMTVEQFYAGKAMVLGPALVNRWLKEGYNMAFGGPTIFAVERRLTALTVHPLFLEAIGAAGDAAKAPPTTSGKKRLGALTESGSLPVTRVGYREKDVAVGTYGRDLEVSYDVVKYATVQELRIIFLYIGMQIAYDDIGNVFEVIDVGDGSSGAPPTRLQISGAGGAGALVFKDLVTAIARMAEGGFRVTHWVGESDSFIDFLSLAQFSGANERDWTLRELLQSRGPFATPLGILLPSPNPPADADHLGFFDAMFAVARGIETPLMVEADKIIAQRLEEAAISGKWAFWKLCHDASGMIDYSA